MITNNSMNKKKEKENCKMMGVCAKEFETQDKKTKKN